MTSKLKTLLKVIDDRPWTHMLGTDGHLIGYKVEETDLPGIAIYEHPGPWFTACWSSGSYEQQLEVARVEDLPRAVRAMRDAHHTLNTTLATRGVPSALTVEQVLASLSAH
jgi:hypothetical protein